MTCQEDSCLSNLQFHHRDFVGFAGVEGATLCGQRGGRVKMRLTGVTRFPDPVWGTTGCSACEATIWRTAAGPLTGEGGGGWVGGGRGRSWKASVQLWDNACSAQPRPRWRVFRREVGAGSQPTRVTAAVRAGHGQECHRFCTDTHNLKLAKKNTPLGKCKNTMKKLMTSLTSSCFFYGVQSESVQENPLPCFHFSQVLPIWIWTDT